MKTLTIIDTFGFFFRLYYAMSGLKSRDGKPSGMVNGFANFIANLKNEFSSDYIIFALDSKGKTFRSEIDPLYKTNRQKPPEALLEQLPVCIDMIKKMNLASFCVQGYEADDIIASVIKNLDKKEWQIRIVTHDKDLYQLISDNVMIYSPAKKVLYDRDGCFEKYGVYPEQVRDFLAICGDASDNIPGVKGIGEKGAKKLLNDFGGLDEIYANLNKISNNRIKNLLEIGKEKAFLSRRLATLYDKLDVNTTEKAIFPSQNPLFKVKDILEQYSLNRILSSLEKSKEIKQELDFVPNLVLSEDDLRSALLKIKEKEFVSFDTETTSVDSRSARLVGFSFCVSEDEAFYVPVAHSYLGVPKQISLELAKMAVKEIFTHFVIGQNLKYDFRIIKNNLGINPPANYADTMILAWLNNPESSVGMDAIARRLYGYETIKFEDVVKKGETFASVELESAAKYAAEDAWITLRFYHTYVSLLDPVLLNIAKTLEFKFILTLLNMEDSGIKINPVKLRSMIKENAIEIKSLSEQIYSLCADRFNINSTKQLGEILFERLGLAAKKKTKTGYSTDESVLNSLIDSHPVIAKILEYREVYKLQSTYCEPLLNLALKDKNSRIYSNFLQTGTATGRLSSKNPNLQNIPARGSKAKEMRSCFEAEEGKSLISLDYSQIELRLLAYFSKDPALCAAFNNDEDIHARTAINIFGDAMPPHRSIAKSINFGLIYGMGSSKLASQISTSKAQAKEYIERYFAAFPTIKDFLEEIKHKARMDGFTTTILGRKRFFDFANATPMQFAMYERESVNTKFQGSAADIIKIAMVKIYPFLNDDIKLLLQIHDELIFEVKDELANEFGIKAQEIMQNVYNLGIPLKTSLNIAKDWGALK